ncbi:MAG: ABC transporter permease [Flavobacteriales bacterium]|nr:ABC transporter permease [Flavobacteriales bacterium]
MNKIRLIIWREFITRVRKPSFLIMTILGPLLIAGAVMAMAWVGMQEATDYKVLVVDQEGLISRRLEDNKALRLTFFLDGTVWTDSAFKASPYNIQVRLLEGSITENPRADLIYKNKPSEFAKQWIRAELEKSLEISKLQKEGIDREAYARVRKPLDLKLFDVKDLGKESMADAKAMIGFFFGYFMFIFIFMYGVQVMRGVMEEKQNRIVEVLISSVRPFQLMMGKIVGVAMVGFTQFMLWIGITALMLVIGLAVLASSKFDPSVLAEGGMTTQVQEQLIAAQAQTAAAPVDADKVEEFIAQVNIPLVLAVFAFFFVGGYLLYASLLAAIGSAVDSETDTQQFMFPVTIPMIVAIFIAQLAVVNSESPAVLWGSMIPLTAPIVMMVRVVMGTVPMWQLLLSMALLVATFIGSVWLAGRIYRTGILMYGKKVSWKELGRWLLYKG